MLWQCTTICWNMHHIREEDIERFTTGDCHFFARAINKITGWPICAFVDSKEEKPSFHAFIRGPDGRLGDIEGWGSKEDFCNHWYEYEIGEFEWEDFKHQYSAWRLPVSYSIYGNDKDSNEKKYFRPNFGHYSYQRARQLAPVIIEQYYVSLQG